MKKIGLLTVLLVGLLCTGLLFASCTILTGNTDGTENTDGEENTDGDESTDSDENVDEDTAEDIE